MNKTNLHLTDNASDEGTMATEQLARIIEKSLRQPNKINEISSDEEIDVKVMMKNIDKKLTEMSKSINKLNEQIQILNEKKNKPDIDKLIDTEIQASIDKMIIKYNTQISSIQKKQILYKNNAKSKFGKK